MDNSTPMLKQYLAIKAQHKDCLLFFRLGDFYEMFYDDAKIASKALDLVLTARGKTPSAKIPMCGIPYHAAPNYIARLIKAGYKVAICDQLEDPALAKGIVKRDVTRIITSGTYLDESSTESRYVLALTPNAKNIGIAFTDPAVGKIQTNEYLLSETKLIDLISGIAVYECVYPESAEDQIKKIFNHPQLKSKKVTLSPRQDWSFNPDIAYKSLCEHFKVHNLNGYGIEGLKYAVSSSGALLDYLKRMNKQPLRHIDKISLYADDDYVFISPAAYQGLELDNLIRALDETVTAPGRRKFRYWMLHPLKRSAEIIERQDAIRLLKENRRVQESLKILLDKIPDIEKNISRLSCGYTHAKDLLAIRNTLALIPDIQQCLASLFSQSALFSVYDLPELRNYLLETISEDIPLSRPEGKVIRRGYNQELDDLRGLQENGREWLKKLQEREIKRSGINSLKIGYNQVFGYYIEITRTHADKIPSDYIRKQTLVNAERFITPELKEYEEKILTAESKILKIENELIHQIQQKILDHSIELHNFCENIATVDSIYSLSILANSPRYTLPEMSSEIVLDIKEGRHPFVEKTVTENFIPNDTLLDNGENHLIILTGPNMAGKSTYIRQVAVLTILAQTGSYIPAASARIGIVDKIYTRIGAHDDISKGQSTFMVEMTETADILNNMTEKSLVILDEIGRGTSTYDGVSLAWALAEHLAQTKTRTLFATHFHELTALADEYPGVKNYNVAVKEWKDEIVFLHKIVPGSTDDSYGIYVARLAGVPEKIISRARQILSKLELKSDLKQSLKNNLSNESQLNLFDQNTNADFTKITEALDAIDINHLTPVQALQKLQELKEKVN
jgi:DNA mismatch repair protein MutS